MTVVRDAADAVLAAGVRHQANGLPALMSASASCIVFCTWTLSSPVLHQHEPAL